MLLDTILRGYENRIWLPKNMCGNLKLERNSKVRTLMLDVPSSQVFVMSHHNTPLKLIRQEMLLIIEAIDQKLKTMEIMASERVAELTRMKTMTEEEWRIAKEKARMGDRMGE